MNRTLCRLLRGDASCTLALGGPGRAESREQRAESRELKVEAEEAELWHDELGGALSCGPAERAIVRVNAPRKVRVKMVASESGVAVAAFASFAAFADLSPPFLCLFHPKASLRRPPRQQESRPSASSEKNGTKVHAARRRILSTFLPPLLEQRERELSLRAQVFQVFRGGSLTHMIEPFFMHTGQLAAGEASKASDERAAEPEKERVCGLPVAWSLHGGSGGQRRRSRINWEISQRDAELVRACRRRSMLAARRLVPHELR